MNNKQKGNAGELIAALYLILKGYTILERNFLVHGGEIDIIARKNRQIAIIEVKTRKNDDYGTPKEAVDYYKRKHIIHATRVYLKMKGIYDDKVRFDVMEIYLPKLKINHIKHAFEIF